MTETITVTRKGSPTGTYSDGGNPVLSADTSVPVEIIGFAPKESEETEFDQGTLNVSAGTIYAASGTVFYPTDRFTIRGVAGWQVRGELQDWVAQNDGGPAGVVVTVERAS